MTLYEINQELQALIEASVDEDGCIVEETFEAINNLQMARDQKLRNIGCLIKNLNVDLEGLENEKRRIESRRKTTENQIERLKNLLKMNMGEDEKFSTPEVKLSRRASTQVQTTEGLDITTLPEGFWKYGKAELRKTEIKKYFKEHPDEKVEGVWVEEVNNVLIQ